MQSMSRTKFVVMSVMTLCVFAALLGLGTWQVQRLAWKKELLQSIETRIHDAPRPIETYFKAEAGTDYWPVTVSGTFFHTGERHFFATHKGASGYFVYTPLETAPNTFVFINRGFVPYDLKDAAKRADGQTKGAVTITGLARTILKEKPSSLVPDNDLTKNVFYWKDIKAMSTSADLPANAMVADVFVDADVSSTPPSGLPVGGVTILDLPNSHLQYAVTWYGLAATLFAIWCIMAWRQRRGQF